MGKVSAKRKELSRSTGSTSTVDGGQSKNLDRHHLDFGIGGKFRNKGHSDQTTFLDCFHFLSFIGNSASGTVANRRIC